jgi:hypothetical protein
LEEVYNSIVSGRTDSKHERKVNFVVGAAADYAYPTLTSAIHTDIMALQKKEYSVLPYNLFYHLAK